MLNRWNFLKTGFYEGIKVRISLPRELLEIADRIAAEKGVSRRRVIAELLEKEEQGRIDALMAEGCRAIADENYRLAEEAFPLASEMSTEWKDDADGKPS